MKIDASQVRLVPGNRLFEYGLEIPAKMKMSPFGVVVPRDRR